MNLEVTDERDVIVAIAAAGRYSGLVGGAYEGAAGFRGQPVMVRADRTVSPPPVRRDTRSIEPAAIVALSLSLGNGISLSLEVATASIPKLVRELAA